MTCFRLDAAQQTRKKTVSTLNVLNSSLGFMRDKCSDVGVGSAIWTLCAGVSVGYFVMVIEVSWRSWGATKGVIVLVMQGKLNQATLPTDFLHRKLPTKAFLGRHN